MPYKSRINYEYKRNCKVCGESFYSKDMRIKFCSDKCRKIARKESIMLSCKKYRKNNPKRTKSKNKKYREYYQWKKFEKEEK